MKKYVTSVLKNSIYKVLDVTFVPFVFFSALLLKNIRRRGISKFYLSKMIFFKIGVFPIRDHYYEPMFNPNKLRYPLDKDRSLPGINLNKNVQLNLLNNFCYQNELLKFSRGGGTKYYYNNGNFGAGDAEYLYNMIRYFKPKKLIEVGSGYSTLMAIEAIEKNMLEDSAYRCEHVCIEPYEMKWLEKTSAQIIRKKVEEVELGFFQSLKENDILFIDSSHVIRPQGDVLFEYLEILPSLNKNVIIHIHDIFTPKDYPDDWVKDEIRLWNEQYLFEAFMSNNNDFEIIGALNYLSHNYTELLFEKCPVLKEQEGKLPPSSMWIRKIK